jgi:outer membrane receptor protein involved in Fe transport
LPGEREAQRLGSFVQFLANPALAPERQRGGDGGVEVYLGRASLAATYYHQRAINLIDLITIPTAPGALLTVQYQNVARVKNEGWEFEAHAPLGPVDLTGTYSIMNSIVQELPANFGGDYLVGDPILGIPHTLAGATVTYSLLRQTTLTASMTYIGHWTELDQIAYYGFLFGGQPYRGSQRAYWMEYPAVMKFGVGASQAFGKSFEAFVRADNVGNNLRSEQNNFQIATPRSVIVGANVRY